MNNNVGFIVDGDTKRKGIHVWPSYFDADYERRQILLNRWMGGRPWDLKVIPVRLTYLEGENEMEETREKTKEEIVSELDVRIRDTIAQIKACGVKSRPLSLVLTKMEEAYLWLMKNDD